jgi:hypothetical protein
MRARSVPVVLLVAGLLGLGTADPALAAADATPPVLHSVSLTSPGPFTAGDTVTVQWDATDDVGISQVQVGYLDAVGHERVAYANGGATSGQVLIDYRWADGPVTVRWVWVYDVNDNWTVYRPNGTWSSYPSAEGTHQVNLHAAEFTTHDTGEDVTAPSLDAFARTSPATLTAGDPVSVSWAESDAHSSWIQAVFVDANCRQHALGGPAGNLSGSSVVDNGWANGDVHLAEVEVSDDSGNLRVYLADGSTRTGPGPNQLVAGPSHSFDFAAAAFFTHDTGADTAPPVLTAVALSAPGPFAEGDAVSYTWSATDSSSVAGMRVRLIDGAGKLHYVAAPAGGQPATAMVDSSWAPGSAWAEALEVWDALGNVATYYRDGRLTRSPTCGADGSSSFDLSALDVRVETTPAPTPAPAPDTTAPTVVANEFASPTTLAPSAPVSWSGSDAGSGVASYDVAYRTATATRGFQGWVQPPAWQGLTTTGFSAGISPGTTLCFLVRARDNAGNVSPWSASRCVTRAYDDSILKPSAGWYRTYQSTLYGGSALRTTLHGATVTTGTVTVRHLAVLATTCSSCGKVVVEIGGQSVATLNLASSTTRRRQLLSVPLAASRTGTVLLRVVSTGRVVEIDGLLLSRV